MTKCVFNNNLQTFHFSPRRCIRRETPSGGETEGGAQTAKQTERGVEPHMVQAGHPPTDRGSRPLDVQGRLL